MNVFTNEMIYARTVSVSFICQVLWIQGKQNYLNISLQKYANIPEVCSAKGKGGLEGSLPR